MRPSLALPQPRTPSLALVASIAAVCASLIVGVVAAYLPTLGGVAIAAALFGPIALIDLPLALAAFTTTLFLRLVPGVGLASSAAGMICAVAWLGVSANRFGHVRARLAAMRGLVAVLLVLLLWLAMTTAWAREPMDTLEELPYWGLAALLFVVVATALDTERRVRLLAGAFVVGALLSVVYGIASGDISESTGAIESASGEGRFSSISDPNDLAAGLIAAVALALGLLPGMRRGPLRIGVAATVALLLVGVAATQSRGGLVAAVVCILATFVVARGRRVAAAFAVLGLAAVMTFALATTPGALERVTTNDNGGNGRSDLWRVAGQMFAEHPVAGVGINQFRVESPRYVRRPGNLDAVELIVEEPKVVHNTYLQLLAETGFVGLGLYLALVLACMASGLRAANAFHRQRRLGAAALAQGVVIAQVGMFAAMFFLSIGDDLRAWLLLALGPALLAVARQPAPQGPIARAAR